MQDLIDGINASVIHSFATPRGIVAFFTSIAGLGLLILASVVRTMVRLRIIAVTSNLLLLTSALLTLSPIHIGLYLILIPFNTYRLWEIQVLTQKVEKASLEGDLSGVWLKRYMKPRALPAGAVLFNQGDKADSLYLLVEGELELVEIGKTQPIGQLFGEISLFSPSGLRTLTARCATDCVILDIAEPTFKQLYFENPEFAFQIANLITQRLSADIDRLHRQVQDLQKPST